MSQFSAQVACTFAPVNQNIFYMRKNYLTGQPRKIVLAPNSEPETHARVIYGFGSLVFSIADVNAVEKKVEYSFQDLCKSGVPSRADIRRSLVKKHMESTPSGSLHCGDCDTCPILYNDVEETDDSGILIVAYDQKGGPFAYKIISYSDVCYLHLDKEQFIDVNDEEIMSFGIRHWLAFKETKSISRLPEGITIEDIKNTVKQYYPEENESETNNR